MNIDREVDLRGMNCPLPVLHTRKALKEVASGNVLRVITSDPGSMKDLESLCNQCGDELISSASEEEGFVFFIRKS